jgi:glycosyltransferase 2 family protein
MGDRIARFQRLLSRHPRALAVGQVVVLVVFFGIVGWAIRSDLHGAGERLEQASATDFLIGCAILAAYYLLFVIGWIRILAAWRVEIGYGAALRAEMVSMLAKYIPGGVWTPAARVVAARRAGITDAGLVTASILVEAGLSAVSGVLVFVVSLAWMDDINATIWPVILFGIVVAILLHPRVFEPLATKVLRRFGTELPPLSGRTLVGLLLYYSFTWLVGGAALFFLVRSVGGDPSVDSIAFLGGTSAVGAILAVLVIFAPSGLGFREGVMYGLLLTITNNSVALGTTVLNRVAITAVEVLLLVAGVLALRLREDARALEAELQPESEPSVPTR